MVVYIGAPINSRPPQNDLYFKKTFHTNDFEWINLETPTPISMYFSLKCWIWQNMQASYA